MLKTILKKITYNDIRGRQRIFRANKINIYKVQFEKINPCQKKLIFTPAFNGLERENSI